MGKSTTSYKIEVNKSVDFKKEVLVAAQDGKGGFAPKSPFYNGDKIVIEGLSKEEPLKTLWRLGSWETTSESGEKTSGTYYVLACTLNGKPFEGVSPTLFGRRGYGDDYEDFAIGNLTGVELAEACNNLGGRTFIYWSRPKKEGRGRVSGFLTEEQYQLKTQK